MYGAAIVVALGPVEIVEALQQRRAQPTREMMAAHAPVEAGPAQRATLAGVHGPIPVPGVAASGGALSSSPLAIGALDPGGDDPGSPPGPGGGGRSSARGGSVRIRWRP